MKRRIARKIARRFAKRGHICVRLKTWQKAMPKLTSEEVLAWVLVPSMKQAEAQLEAFKAAIGGRRSTPEDLR